MIRKPFFSLLASATLAFVLACCLFGASNVFAGRAAIASRPTVIHVIEHATYEKIIDVGLVGDSPGDLDIFSSPLYNATNKRQVGHDNGSCIRTVVGRAYECTWTNFLKGGQISVEGPYYDKADSMLSIIGGTGIYSHVRGQMKIHARGNPHGSEYDYIFFLNWH